MLLFSDLGSPIEEGNDRLPQSWESFSAWRSDAVLRFLSIKTHSSMAIRLGFLCNHIASTNAFLIIFHLQSAFSTINTVMIFQYSCKKWLWRSG